MVYNVPITSIFIDWTVSITSSASFFIQCWKSTIIDFIAIIQKIIFILSSLFTNRSLKGIGFNHNLPPFLILFTIFENMYLNTFSVGSNPPLNTVQLMVWEVLTVYENIELLPYGDSSDLSLSNNYPTECTALVLVAMTVRNKLVWVEARKDYWAWGTNS